MALACAFVHLLKTEAPRDLIAMPALKKVYVVGEIERLRPAC
jgi:hypothetical protein